MSARATYVLDTNVLVDALLFKSSHGRRAFELTLSLGTLVMSVETFAEVVTTLRKPRLQKYIGETEARTFLIMLSEISTLVTPAERISACRDPKDDKFLELAVAADATAILSRDLDLLILDPFRGIRILEPIAFVRIAAPP